MLQQHHARQKPLGAGALIRKFRRHLRPTLPLRPDDGVKPQRRVVEHDFVEMLMAGQIGDRTYVNAGPFEIDQKLCQPHLPLIDPVARSEQRDHVVRTMRA